MIFDQPFYFLRHGQTASNAAQTIGGATDLPLTEQGHAQAALAATIPLHVASIWCSPLQRAQQTAAAMGRPVILLPDLQERNWGDWEGQPRSVMVREATPPNGESPEAFRARIRAAMAQITGPFPVLIVGHSGTAREIHAMLSDAPFRRPTNGELSEWFKDDTGRWQNRVLSPNLQTSALEARQTS